jgi:hypothetical protein
MVAIARPAPPFSLRAPVRVPSLLSAADSRQPAKQKCAKSLIARPPTCAWSPLRSCDERRREKQSDPVCDVARFLPAQMSHPDVA